MSHINRKRRDTRMQIIKAGAKHFIEDGYTKTTMKRISQELDLSPGNITFYFPTKDHLLAVLVNELYDFQSLEIEKSTARKENSLYIYCLKLVTIAAVCADNEVLKDFYTSAYTSPYTLSIIRKNDTQKTKAVFGEFCKSFSEEDWSTAEILVSGVECGVIMSAEEGSELRVLLEKALNLIMILYNVPEDMRKQNIDRVLSLDYKQIGDRVLCEFRKYIDKTNEIAEI